MTLVERLRSERVEERLGAIAALGERGDAAPDELEALVECLGHARKAVQRPAAEAFAALAAAGVAVGAVLDRALASSDPRRRWGAAFALSLLGDPPPHTVPVLLETLGGDDGDMRWAAAAILRRLRDREGLVARLVLLVAAGNAAQRKMALYCLRDLDARASEVERAVLAGLGDTAWDVRLAAIAALPRLAMDRPAAADRLLDALHASDLRVRRAAAAALAILGERSERVVAALRDAARAEDPSLRKAAEAALRRLT